jgi:phosphatidylinositol alpha-mannosyltransferase
VKIGLVSPYDYVHPGGVNVHVAHLAARFRELGHDVTVIAPVARDQEVPPGVLPISRSVATVKTGGSDSRVSLSPRATRRIKHLLERERFDVVHLHNPLTPVVSISFLRHRDAAPDTALVATLHEYRTDKNPLFTLGDPVIYRWIERLDGRIAVSEASRDYNSQYFPGDYVVIPNGIDVAHFGAADVRPFPRYRDGRPTVLFVGRLEHRKGFKYLLRAWPWVREVMPDARLLVVGSFDKRRKRPYVLYARQHAVRGVSFVGPVTEAEKPRYYRSADLFCAPSAGFESFGIVLLEGMAAGVAVVASDIPGYRTVLDDGVQGLLVQPRHPQALAKAIIDLLGDPERRARMGRAGQRKAPDYDWSRVARQVLDFYRQVLAAVRGNARSPKRSENDRTDP